MTTFYTIPAPASSAGLFFLRLLRLDILAPLDHLEIQAQRDYEKESWFPGRRSILLRPFWPSGRVVATKSTTSGNPSIVLILYPNYSLLQSHAYCDVELLFFF